ncbi:DUF305 domain-containing protein [Actinosynnema pretiosum subsp. pretiosum]|uniref:DUF305 domain-containing protein n=2 Tax=Actinosynnema TaxID=40566 RepID=C6WGT7_ACTMD|nr:DUF305 domain-containing protein [Actinosynnema mirum]ACU36005.1 protein of unknown function DUF305 [Actinosynnema mirum DSM 43827]QUF06300.1 DUF305 domain-containing protein [Actinosynnema pretiosum subsp. pretiosum]
MRAVILALVVAVFGAAAGCTAGADPDAAPVIAPGRPGEAGRTVAPGDVGTDLWSAPTEVDLGYVARMITHHRQALAMTELAPERAGNDVVRRIASRIHDVQGPEIQAMESWQRQYGQVGEAHGHVGGVEDHGGMPGMATERQLAELAAAKGADFDRLFVRLMVAHHEGALEMALEQLSEGTDVRVEEMANDVVATQSVEIERMRAIPL